MYVSWLFKEKLCVTVYQCMAMLLLLLRLQARTYSTILWSKLQVVSKLLFRSHNTIAWMWGPKSKMADKGSPIWQNFPGDFYLWYSFYFLINLIIFMDIVWAKILSRLSIYVTFAWKTAQQQTLSNFIQIF